MKSEIGKIVLITMMILSFSSTLTAQIPLKVGLSEDSPPFSFPDEKQEPKGIFPAVLSLVDKYLENFSFTLDVLPWSRAQLYVKDGDLDGFLTYPSESRRSYAVFTSKPLFTEDIGYLFYHKENPQKKILTAARSFDDLKNLIVVTTKGSLWESDNIPNFLKRVEVINNQIRLNRLIIRREGDFTILGPEEVAMLTTGTTMEKEIAFVKVNFIPNSKVPFHLGIRASHPQAQTFIKAVDDLWLQPSFKKELEEVLAFFRPH